MGNFIKFMCLFSFSEYLNFFVEKYNCRLLTYLKILQAYPHFAWNSSIVQNKKTKTCSRAHWYFYGVNWAHTQLYIQGRPNVWGHGGLSPHHFLAGWSTLFQSEGQIMPTFFSHLFQKNGSVNSDFFQVGEKWLTRKEGGFIL